MQLSHSARAVFDEANLVSCAGLVPALSLAERAGWSEYLEALSVSSPNAAAKADYVNSKWPHGDGLIWPRPVVVRA